MTVQQHAVVQGLLRDEGFCLNSELASAALGTLQQLGKEHKIPPH